MIALCWIDPCIFDLLQHLVPAGSGKLLAREAIIVSQWLRIDTRRVCSRLLDESTDSTPRSCAGLQLVMMVTSITAPATDQ